jgi:hypothetical protein
MPASYEQLTTALKSVLRAESLDALGRSVGFIRRLRSIRANLFVWAVVLSRFASGSPGFAEASKWYERLGGTRLYPRPFQMRFKSASAVALFASAFEAAVAPWRQKPARSKHPLRRLFPDVVLWDSTMVELADELRRKLKGTGKVGAAALKAAVAVSVFGLVPIVARMTAGNVNDMLLFPSLKLFAKGTLLLFDKGFLVYERLGDIERAGLHYLCPMRLNGNPVVVKAINAPSWMHKKLKANPEGIQLRTLLPKGKRIGRTLDFEVILPVAQNAHNRTPTRTRLVIVPGPSLAQRPYLTTLNAARWCPATLKEMYRLRWQIELVFKELKQHLNLETVPSKDEYAVRVFAWASLLALVVSRMVAGWIQPLATLTGLAADHRPTLISRALRRGVLFLERVLVAPMKEGLFFARLLADELSREARSKETQRNDTFRRLLTLLPAP